MPGSGRDYYDAKVKMLGDYIEHHVIEEHTEMFPKCRRSKMDLIGLRDRMEARKKGAGGSASVENLRPSRSHRVSGHPQEKLASTKRPAMIGPNEHGRVKELRDRR
jgi:hypothetical protein